MADGTISGPGIAGVVVGVLILLALVGGSAWSLVRRRRREREREASLLPDGGGGGGAAGSDCLAGFFGTAKRPTTPPAQRSPSVRGSPAMQQAEPRRSIGGFLRGGGGEGGRRSFGGEREDNVVYMYGGSNVGRTPGEVPGRVEAEGDSPPVVQRPPPVVPRKKVGSQRRGPVFEMEGSPVGTGAA